MKRTLIPCLAAGVWLVSGQVAHSAGEYSAAGANAAAIQGAVDAFRNDLGGGFIPGPNGSFGGVRREINWDGVPDALSAPNDLPANFFNVNSPRGAVFEGASAFRVSGNPGNGAPSQFSEINATYPDLFTTFSEPRLFTGLGSNIVDVLFFVPGTDTPALTTGFGAVFTDVDFADVTRIQFFGTNNQPFADRFVPNTPGNETLSFLGLDFDAPVISRVRITSGNTPVGPNEIPGQVDVVVMDDFIYGEPVARAVAVPEPGSLALLGSGLLGLLWYRRRLSKA